MGLTIVHMMAFPRLDQHSYLFKDVLGHDPEDAERFCKSLQDEWHKKYSKDDNLARRMKEFKKERCIHLVYVSDKFGNSMPSGIPLDLLSKLYDQCPVPAQVEDHSHLDDESGRKNKQQLQQHLSALLYMLHAAETKAPLTEELLKCTHSILMKDLYTDTDENYSKINAGEYRQCSMIADTHTFPPHESIPGVVKKIVDNYESFIQQEHEPIWLAAWLLYEVLTIHPFMDGNGRVSRLLWCYSLMREGLPFPVIPFPEHSKAYKKYINCIVKDRNSVQPPPCECKNLTSLTLISITMTWKNFMLNLKSESPEKHAEIVKWLEASGNVKGILETIE